MELQKHQEENNNIPQSLRHLSQKPIVTFLKEGQMKKVASLLPNTIEQAIKGTPIAMLMRVVDRENIEAFLAVALTNVASMINVDERLNIQEHQIPFICKQLVDTYKNESLADFKICFERGAMGKYDDKLLRVDGAVITNWMNKYLEEKYQVIENKLMSEKENFYEPVKQDRRNEARDLLALLKLVVGEVKPEENPNDYFRVKMQHAKEKRQRQEHLNRVSSDFYAKKGGYTEIKMYEDDLGYYVYAENEHDAKEIYELATKKRLI
jgi:hypothetical protein